MVVNELCGVWLSARNVYKFVFVLQRLTKFYSWLSCCGGSRAGRNWDMMIANQTHTHLLAQSNTHTRTKSGNCRWEYKTAIQDTSVKNCTFVNKNSIYTAFFIKHKFCPLSLFVVIRSTVLKRLVQSGQLFTRNQKFRHKLPPSTSFRSDRS